MRINAITVCVEYDDLLAITLPRNRKHVDRMLVITHPRDRKTQEVVKSVPGTEILLTTSFYKNGAAFNKGLAMEEGFDVLGRDGWILIWDADTLFPDDMSIPERLPIGNLYTPRRRILTNPKDWSEDFNWKRARLRREPEFCGYFQLFHADDPRCEEMPWYETDWQHAGGADGMFQTRWPGENKFRLPFEVLHIGPVDTNWFGRQSERIDNEEIGGAEIRQDMMEEFTRKTLRAGPWLHSPNSRNPLKGNDDDT